MDHICLHVIQSFPPNNLNRDDTGAPKDCIFGGVRRARVSSQAWKRSVRMEMRLDTRLEDHHATRTKRLQHHLAERLRQKNLDQDTSSELASLVVDALKIKRVKARPDETEVLIFVTDGEIEALASWAIENEDRLKKEAPGSGVQKAGATPGDPSADAPSELEAEPGEAETKSKTKESKRWQQLCADAQGHLVSPKSVDTALFGRMLAEINGAECDAAVSVAHAISTHAVRMEEDYYTAVDDIKLLTQGADQGSAMLGEVLYQSAVLYRFASIDCKQLLAGLGPNSAHLAAAALEGFTNAFLRAIPTGKQTSFAAYNLPSAVLVTVDAQPLSLANAFLSPLRQTEGSRMDTLSWDALLKEWGALSTYAGSTKAVAVAVLATIHAGTANPNGAAEVSLTELPGIVAGLIDSPQE